MKNCYEVLGILPTADEREIKHAYKRLAMKTHPDIDKSETASDDFIEIKTAYEILMDPILRKAHDEQVLPKQSHYTTHTGAKKERINISLLDSFMGRILYVSGKPVRIPAGVRSGTKLFANDTLYYVEVLADKKFKRNNDDLMVDVNISCIDAMVGVEVKLRHLDDRELIVQIPAGIQYGQLVCVVDEGMPNPEFDKKGHLFLKCIISTATNLTDAQKSIILAMQEQKQVSL